jgi:hypothetical protein
MADDAAGAALDVADHICFASSSLPDLRGLRHRAEESGISAWR